MHECMQYDPIQGQGHKPFKVGNVGGHFQKISPPPFMMGASSSPLILTYGMISKFDPAGFLIFVFVFVSRVFELGTIVRSSCALPSIHKNVL